MSQNSSNDMPVGTGPFTETHWSLVLSAGGGDDTRAQEALTRLCQTYWYPLYAFVRRNGHGPEDAQDLTQSFFAHLLEHKVLTKAEPAKGKFRAFLLASLRHFLANERVHAQAQKRGGGRPLVSLDTGTAETRLAAEAASHDSPDRAYERTWAVALLEQVMEQLRAEQKTAGKAAQFEQLQDCLMADRDSPRYAELAARLGSSEEALRMTVSRLRRRYRDLLRQEVAHTVSSPAEVEEEIHHLFAALAL